jgi:hypothetical protein
MRFINCIAYIAPNYDKATVNNESRRQAELILRYYTRKLKSIKSSVTGGWFITRVQLHDTSVGLPPRLSSETTV